MRTWLMVLLMMPPLVLAEPIGRLEGRSDDGQTFHLGMESADLIRIPQTGNSDYDSILRFREEPCVFMEGATALLVCSELPAHRLSGLVYQQVGEPEKKTRVVTMKCVRGCSNKVPTVMQYIPVQC